MLPSMNIGLVTRIIVYVSTLGPSSHTIRELPLGAWLRAQDRTGLQSPVYTQHSVTHRLREMRQQVIISPGKSRATKNINDREKLIP